jgi:hypothetical protein
LAFPNNQRLPADRREPRLIFFVALPVRLQLWKPEIESGLWKPRELAIRIIMTMPETSVNENDFFLLSKD